LGRHSDADVRLPLPDVSRRHCRFVFTEAGWQVVDLNSLNGVYVNGERVHRAPLRHLDLVRIGSLTFEVNLQAGTETVQLAAGHDVLQSIAEALPPPGPGAECNHRKAS
jgi:pSer/pThr/pTyr-binding forkhead associated (FHA) protein